MGKVDWGELGLNAGIALGLAVVCTALAGLVYWLLGVPALTGRLAQGFVWLWAALVVIFAVLQAAERFLSLNIHDRYTAFVWVNAVAGAAPLLLFAAFSALLARGATAGLRTGGTIAVFGLGAVACAVAQAAVTTFFRGQLYRMINTVAALGGYVVFTVWPAAARVVAGWLGAG